MHERTCPFTLASTLESLIAGDNEHDLDAALGYKLPRQFGRQYHSSYSAPFVAA